MKINKIGIYCIFNAVVLICCFKIITQYTESKEIRYSDIVVEMKANKDGTATISGQDSSGSIFKVDLNYCKDDVILKDAYFIDFTGDNKKELYLEVNILNSVSSDFNTIIIYDIENGKILFPTNDKSFIYNGYIDKIKCGTSVKNVIIYSSYTKINGIPIEDENSVIVWNGDSFETLEYKNKLIAETNEYIIYYKKLLSYGQISYRLLILNPKTLETIQELELMMEETSITKKIRDQELVKLINDEPYDLYIEGYRIQHWDQTLKEFG